MWDYIDYGVFKGQVAKEGVAQDLKDSCQQAGRRRICGR